MNSGILFSLDILKLLPPQCFMPSEISLGLTVMFERGKHDLSVHSVWEMHLPDSILVIMEAGPGYPTLWFLEKLEEAWLLTRWGHFLVLEPHLLWLMFPSRHLIFSWELPLPWPHARAWPRAKSYLEPSKLATWCCFLYMLRSKSGTLIRGRTKGLWVTCEWVRAGRRDSELVEGPWRPCLWCLTDLGLNLEAAIYQVCDPGLLISSP